MNLINTQNFATNFKLATKNYRNKEIWTFGGGKGGVGKSVLCSNVGLYLTQRGHRVLLVDADFGAANLHTYLGMPATTHSLSDFLMMAGVELENIITESPFNNLFLINGGEDPFKISNPRYFQVNRLLENLYRLDYDYILIDLGAGTTSQVVDLFCGGSKMIVVCLPEPASIENAYRFIKYAFFRGFKKIIQNEEVQDYLEKLLAVKQTSSVFNIEELNSNIERIDKKTAVDLQNYMHNFEPKLVMNMVRSSSDIKLGSAITNSCQKYLGINLEYLGFVEQDDSLINTVKNRTPIVFSEPFSRSARGFKKIGDSLRQNLPT